MTATTTFTELIPAIDLRGGRCVRLFKGDFAAETVYSDDPLTVLERYRSLGARRVHVVDLDGARDGTQLNRDVICELAAQPGVRLQVGGGLRTLERIDDLLSHGVERAVIGSVAVTAPATVVQWMRSVDAQRFVLALDVRFDASRTPKLAVHGWQQTSVLSLWSAVERYARHGLVHVLCTDVSRDGALGGPNCELYTEAVRRFPDIRWQASGGVATAQDLALLHSCGVAAIISGKAMLENRISAEELQPYLRDASSPAST
jgi:phosphoribosylformimino-5-aminoimidazole carboxamide ribotide isomerase